MLVGHLYVVLGKRSVQVLCPLDHLIGSFVVVVVVVVELYEFFVYFGY